MGSDWIVEDGKRRDDEAWPGFGRRNRTDRISYLWVWTSSRYRLVRLHVRLRKYNLTLVDHYRIWRRWGTILPIFTRGDDTLSVVVTNEFDDKILMLEDERIVT